MPESTKSSIEFHDGESTSKRVSGQPADAHDDEDISFRPSATQTTNVLSQDDIHFQHTATHSASEQSVEYHVDESRLHSRVNPERAAPAAEETEAEAAESAPVAEPPTQVKPRAAPAAAEAPDTVVVATEAPKAAAAAPVPAPKAPVPPENPDELCDPPQQLSRRASYAARTPRSLTGAPKTPRTRSPNSTHRPAPGAVESESEAEAEAPAAAAGVPPLVPGSERAAAPAAAAGTQSYARASTAASDFSSTADADPTPAAAAPVPTPAAPASEPAAMVVTEHARTFPGAEWESVVAASRETVERTVGNETGAAIGVDPQFVRVTSVEATAEGMMCGVSVAHDPALTTLAITEKMQEYPYETTMTLMELRTARGVNQQYGLGGLLAAEAAHDEAVEVVVEDDEPSPEVSAPRASSPTKPQQQQQQQAAEEAAAAAAPAKKSKKAKKAEKAKKPSAVPAAATATTAASRARTSNPRQPSPQPAPAVSSSQPSAARERRERAHKALPELLTTPRLFHARSPRPGVGFMAGETASVVYMQSVREGTLAGSSRHSAAPATPRAASVSSRRSPSAPTHRSSVARTIIGNVPPQHALRGVKSIGQRPRPVIQGAGAGRSINGVEHNAETHSASRRSRSPQQPPLAVGVEAAADADVVVVVTPEEEYVLVVEDAAEPATAAAGADEVSVEFDEEGEEEAAEIAAMPLEQPPAEQYGDDDGEEPEFEYEGEVESAAPATIEEAAAYEQEQQQQAQEAAASHEAEAEAEEDAVVVDAGGDDAPEELPSPNDEPAAEADAHGEAAPQEGQKAPQGDEEEEPVPAAAPNPFV